MSVTGCQRASSNSPVSQPPLPPRSPVKNDTCSRSSLRRTSITANRDRRGGWCSSSQMYADTRSWRVENPSFSPAQPHLSAAPPREKRLFPDRLSTRKNEPFSKDVGGFGLRESSLEKEREREREKGRIYLYSHQIHAGARDPRTCHFPHRWLRLGKLQRSPLV